MSAAETYPPARTLLVVRTGASMAELKVPSVAEEPSASNLRAVPNPSQHSKNSSSPIWSAREPRTLVLFFRFLTRRNRGLFSTLNQWNGTAR